MDNLLIEDCPAEDAAAGDNRYGPDAAELDRILNLQISTPQSQRIPRVVPEGSVVIVGVRFRTGGKTYFFDPGNLTCTEGQHAIVETAAGLEFGEVCISNRMVDEALVVQPLRPVVRIATPQDVAHNQENHEREVDAYRIGIEKILAHKLDMKLVSVQYTFDNSKLLFYFTSAGRVDFRELVKDLASVFHIRIELRQIGLRDEARMVGGLGACGRPLCCNTFLSDFGQVSMKMAKEQNLSLNSSKISGCCGRLMCCLRFEYDTYVEEIRRTPAPGSLVNTPDGPGVVTEILPLLGEVKVSLRDLPDSAPKKFKREDVTPQAPASRPGDAGFQGRASHPAHPATADVSQEDGQLEGTRGEEPTAEPDQDL
jgi:cell fate regulator YaaT (PSP1 superfamily)